jgi:fatty acid desaturase
LVQMVPGVYMDYSDLMGMQAFDMLPISNDLIYFNTFLTWYYSAVAGLKKHRDHHHHHHHAVVGDEDSDEYQLLGSKETSSSPIGSSSRSSSSSSSYASTTTHLLQLSYWNTLTNQKRLSLLASDKIMSTRRRRARLEMRRHFEVAENLKDFVERCKMWEE